MSQDPLSREQIVYVPVPESRLLAVYAVLAQPGMKDGVPEREESEPTDGYVPDELTQEEIARLKREYNNQAVHVILDTLADHAGEWVSKQEFVRATGRSDYGIAADLGGLTKFARKVFRKNKWPMEVKGDANGLAIYRMSPQVALWWKEA